MLERSTIPAVRRRARPLSIHSIMLATALLLHASVAAATPLISEVFYDAVGSDDGWVFVELAGVPGTPLDGLFLEGVNGSNGAIGTVDSARPHLQFQSLRTPPQPEM